MDGRDPLKLLISIIIGSISQRFGSNIRQNIRIKGRNSVNFRATRDSFDHSRWSSIKI